MTVSWIPEVVFALGEGREFRLERLHVLHGGALLHPVGVALHARFDDLHVGFHALQLGPSVFELARRGDPTGPERVDLGLQLRELGRLRKVLQGVGELRQAGVGCLQSQEFLLVGGTCFHDAVLPSWRVVIGGWRNPRGRCAARSP